MMQRVRNFFAFPLLAKDLTERAARPRTFVLRVVFGLMFIGVFWIFMNRSAGRWSDSDDPDQSLMALLGMGRSMFDQLVVILLGAVLLFQPALMAGVITHEKERETLSLLFLADMKPWRLLIQKFIGGLLPMASLLLYGLPLAGIAYTYGGVTPGKMLAAFLVVTGSWLQIGAFSLLCSAWFRTTTSATVAAYLFGIVGIFAADYSLFAIQSSMGDESRQSMALDWRTYRVSPAGAHAWIYRFHGYDGGYEGETWNDVQFGSANIPGRIVGMTFAAAPLFITSGVFLLLARCFLVRRAFSAPRHIGRRLFRRLDRWFEKLNGHFGGRSIKSGKNHSFPDTQPVLWRETSRGILGRAQHLVRLGLALHILIWLVLMWTFFNGRWDEVQGRAAFCAEVLLLFGVLAVAAVSVQSIGAERTRQTLDILLTTPVTAREIVLQKTAAARRLGWIFIGNLVFLGAGNVWLSGGQINESWMRVRGFDVILLGEGYVWFHLACILVGLPVLFALVRWFAMWIGVRFRNRHRAFQTCLALLALWCALPLIGRFLMPRCDSVRMWSAALSPQGLLYVNKMAAFQVLTDVTESGGMNDLRETTIPSNKRKATFPAPPPSSPITGALMVLIIQCSFVAIFKRLSLHAAENRLRGAQ